MTLQADDPRLTAYVLGELEADELAAFERELAASPEAQSELDAIRETVALVRRELTADLAAAGDANRNGYIATGAIAAELDDAAPAHARAASFDLDDEEEPRRRTRLVALVTAAAILAALTAAIWLPTRQVAMTGQDGGVGQRDFYTYGFNEGSGHHSATGFNFADSPDGGGSLTLVSPSQEGVTVNGQLSFSPNGQPANQAQQGRGVSSVSANLYGEQGAGVAVAQQRAVSLGTLAPNPPTATVGLPLQRLQDQTNFGNSGDFNHSQDSTITGGGQGGGQTVLTRDKYDDNSFDQAFGRPGNGNPRLVGGRGLPQTPSIVIQEEEEALGGERGVVYTIAKPVWETKPKHESLLGTTNNPTTAVTRGENGNPTGPVVVSNLASILAPAAGESSLVGSAAVATNEAKPEDAEGRELDEMGRPAAQNHWHSGHNTETYDAIIENPFLGVMQNPLSTFSIDVDTASYSNVRRFLNSGALPPPGAVRIEELVNYFRYDYAPPAEADGAPFAAHMEVAECPWRPAHRLVRIGLKGREIATEDRPASNLVFLLDVSGSMDDPQKLPLVKEGMRMLVGQLRENDRVAIVVYAGASGLVLDSTSGDNKELILASIDNLSPGGSTNGAAGIQLAYDIAKRHFLKEGTNRVILATDGDFNVGTTDQSQLVALIEEQAKSDVFLSVLGFGMGNLKDSTLEKLADKGNGNYAYVDSDREARKVLVDQLSGTLVTIAKDVKIQIEFNPARVAGYRLIGYENRLLAKEDFNDDTKDAGEIGAGHTVTALYEVVPVEALQAKADDGAENRAEGDGDAAAGEAAADEQAEEEADEPAEVDALEYLSVARPTDAALASPNLLTLKLRYKEPEGTASKLLKFNVADEKRRIGEATPDFQLAASVAAFGMLLRGSQFSGESNLDAIMEWAQPSLSDDAEGYRREFVDLVRKTRDMTRRPQ